MKAVFPTKGVVIVTKYNVNVLRDYYRNNLINSKLFAMYQQSNFHMQSGNFNYLPKKSNIILYKTHLLTLQQLQEVVAKQMRESLEYNNAQAETQEDSQEKQTQDNFSDEPLDDNFIKNNPFFKTLMATED